MWLDRIFTLILVALAASLVFAGFRYLPIPQPFKNIIIGFLLMLLALVVLYFAGVRI